MTGQPRPLHIAVVDPGGRVPELDNYNRLLLSNPEVQFSYHLPALFGMSSLQLLVSKPDALIIFGSSASVHDNLPWQAELHPWIKNEIENKTPTLGICYGHQLLAHLYGGTIDFAVPSQEKYKGLRRIEFSKAGFWTAKSGRYIVSHRELITKLPSMFVGCAESPECAYEVIAHKHLPVWGIQSHPEAGPEFIVNSVIPLAADESAPFEAGEDFMRKFVLNLLAQRMV